jgi:ligand-binding SRPBCC domain-containing protein
MKTYRHTFTVQAPLEKVAAFYGDVSVIAKLTPPPLITRFHEIQPLGENSRVDFTMWLGPIPVRWLAEHKDVQLPSGFTDQQLRGPFKVWTHRHHLQRVDRQTTKVVDEVSAEPGTLISRLMWLGLPLVFAYRAWITRRTLAAHSSNGRFWVYGLGALVCGLALLALGRQVALKTRGRRGGQ